MHQLLVQTRLMEHIEVGDMNSLLLDQPLWESNLELQTIICETAAHYGRLDILEHMLLVYFNNNYSCLVAQAVIECNMPVLALISKFNIHIPFKFVLKQLSYSFVSLNHVHVMQWLLEQVRPSIGMLLMRAKIFTDMPLCMLEEMLKYMSISSELIEALNDSQLHQHFAREYGHQKICHQLAYLPEVLTRRHICVFL